LIERITGGILMKLAGIVLVILGIVALAYGGVTWTSTEKVVDLGPLQVTNDKTHSLPLPPIAGGVCLIAGVVLLVSAGRQKA
jgi:uncharacterized membrane protein YidH (DUF202 family)